MTSPSFLSRTLLPLSAGFILCCITSCKEHEKVDAQTAEVLEKVEELKLEKAEKEASDSSKPGSNHPLARKGSR